MEKLKSIVLDLGTAKMLTRAQLKKIRGCGGFGGCLNNEVYGCDSVQCCSGCTCHRVNNDWQCQGNCPH